jgi:hypothetical protein
MGRNRRPKAIHDASGTFEKHPERAAAFANEPKPDGPLGPPPAEWRPHPLTEKAEILFAEGKDAYAVAAELGLTWEIAKSLRPTGIRSEAQELLAIWYEVTSQAPPGVLTRSDRLHVELTCRLIRTIRSGKGKSGDYSRVKEYLGKMAMNPADRPKVQVGGGAAPLTNDGKSEVNTFEQLAQEDRDQARIN